MNLKNILVSALAVHALCIGAERASISSNSSRISSPSGTPSHTGSLQSSRVASPEPIELTREMAHKLACMRHMIGIKVVIFLEGIAYWHQDPWEHYCYTRTWDGRENSLLLEKNIDPRFSVRLLHRSRNPAYVGGFKRDFGYVLDETGGMQ